MNAQARSAFDPFAAIVHVRADGRALPTPATQDVLRKLVAGDQDRVLTGAIDVVLDEAGGERTFGLRGGQACLVPSGVWHRLILRQPGDLLFITPARGTRHRPVDAASGDD